MRVTAALLYALVGAVVTPRPAAAADPAEQIDAALDAWLMEEARRIYDGSGLKQDTSPEALYLKGKLLFYEGECAAALKALRQAIEGARFEMSWKALRDRAEETEAVFAKLETRKGSGDRFIFRFAPGPDEMLVPYAEEALGRQLTALTQLLGDKPRRPIEIVFVPSVEALAAASGLAVEQIERTGTVGVTKFGRVMILTPRKLVTGYPWIDTLAHELTHFSITRVSRNRAPIWLHEAVAKLFERRWRSRSFQELTPEEAYLLDRAVREGRLIPLRRFHPSVAYLPDQEDAALAYAQALSFARYLGDKIGETWVRTVLTELGKGKSLDSILLAISQSDLKRLYLWWRQMASAKRHTPVPAVGLMRRRFKQGNVTSTGYEETMLSRDVKRHLRVGDLLRLRGHVEAAVSEYEQARKVSASPTPDVSDRLGACLLDLGRTQETIELLEPIVRLYPSHSTTHIQLGRALAAEKRAFEAIRAFERANAINPFHPEVHCALTELHQDAGHPKEAERETENCRLAALYSGQNPESPVSK